MMIKKLRLSSEWRTSNEIKIVGKGHDRIMEFFSKNKKTHQIRHIKI